LHACVVERRVEGDFIGNNENGFTNEPFHFRMRWILDENRSVTSHQCWAGGGVLALLGKFQLS
jgi:hypothetical protein